MYYKQGHIWLHFIFNFIRASWSRVLKLGQVYDKLLPYSDSLYDRCLFLVSVEVSLSDKAGELEIKDAGPHWLDQDYPVRKRYIKVWLNDWCVAYLSGKLELYLDEINEYFDYVCLIWFMSNFKKYCFVKCKTSIVCCSKYAYTCSLCRNWNTTLT